MKKNKKIKLKEKRILSFLEIFVLICSIFSFSYFVSAQEQEEQETEQANPELADRMQAQDFQNSLQDIFSQGGASWDLLTQLVGGNQFYTEMLKLGKQMTERVWNSEDFQIGCCEEMKNNAICQNLAVAQKDECKEGKWHQGQDCEKTESEGSSVENCWIGCCIDQDKGTCEIKATKKKCETVDKKKWVGDEGNDECLGQGTNECTLGCCLIGENAFWMGRAECKKTAEFEGLDGNQYEFKDNAESEADCLALSFSQKKGACLMTGEEGNKRCEMRVKIECSREGLEFKENILCTNPELNTTCLPTTNTTCVEGKDEVYFLDSCGNLANIYDSSKIYTSGEIPEYWKKIILKNESCKFKEFVGNNKDCGNCDFSLGSKCYKFRERKDNKPTKGENICRDLNCYEVPYYNEKIDKKHGESWCIYDSVVDDPIGDITSFGSAFGLLGDFPTFQFGKDVVGSRHWRYYCEEGEIKNDSCYDYREALCQESEEDTPSGKISVASCVPNDWRQCLAYNQEGGSLIPFDMGGFFNIAGILSGLSSLLKLPSGAGLENNMLGRFNELIPGLGGMQGKCISNSMCLLKHVEVDDYFKFDMCVPKFPPGFELGSSATKEGAQGAEDICKAGSRTGDNSCQVVYVKDISGNKCVANCDCEKPEFVLKMNELCISLGDCGSYVNIEGQGTDGGYDAWEEPGGNKKIPISMLYTMFAIPIPGYKVPFSLDLIERAESGGEGEGVLGELGSQLGMGGEGDGGKSQASGTQVNMDKVTNFRSKVLKNTAGATGVAAIGWGGFAAAGMYIPSSGAFFGAMMGLSSASIAFGAGALTGGLMSVALNLPPGASYVAMGAGGVGGAIGMIMGGFSTGLIAGAIVGAVAAIGLSLFGMGEVEIRKMNFECKPWQQPFGGDCEKCSKDPMKQCTKYRCSSLGSACEFIPAPDGTGDGKCEKAANDGKAPKIFPVKEKFEDDYSVAENPKGFTIKYKGGCVPALKNVKIFLGTDESATCKYGFKDKVLTKISDFELWEAITIGSGVSKEHSFALGMSGTPSQIANDAWSTLTEEEKNNLGSQGIDYDEFLSRAIENSEDIKVYLRCSDRHGNFNTAAYLIDFCPQQQEDTTAPTILSFTPVSETRAKYGKTELDLKFIVNKKAQCKWSREDKEFEDMENNAVCYTQTVSGYECGAKLTSLVEGENTFYFKCKTEGEEGQANQQSQPLLGYKVFVSPSYLNIYEFSPKPGDIFTYGGQGIISKEVDLEVKTEGGAYEGESDCKYELQDGSSDNFPIVEENKKVHKATIKPGAGSYSVKFTCWDKSGNQALNSTNFKVILDNIPPVITRAYGGDLLTIITNENSECYYTTNQTEACNFNFDAPDTYPMEGVETIHTLSWDKGKIHYIKCQDLPYKNLGECFTARPFSLG